MKRTYVYKGFEITVELETVWETSHSITVRAPHGYVAIVHIGKAGHPAIAPIRMSAGNQQPFATEGEALMTGFSAGQRLVDDTLLR